MKPYDMLFQTDENGDDQFIGTPSSGWFELCNFSYGEEETWRHKVLMSHDSNRVIVGCYVYCLMENEWVMTFNFTKHLNGEMVSYEMQAKLLNWHPFCGWDYNG